jgi:hypothetical protein
MGNLDGVKAGDELLLVTKYGGRREKEQEPRTVKVHKVGRTLVHILRWEEIPSRGTDAYRIESGVFNDNYGHSELWKPEDWAAEQSREGLEAALRLHGIEAWRGGKKPIAVLEALLDVMERAVRGEIK